MSISIWISTYPKMQICSFQSQELIHEHFSLILIILLLSVRAVSMKDCRLQSKPINVDEAISISESVLRPWLDCVVRIGRG